MNAADRMCGYSLSLSNLHVVKELEPKETVVPVPVSPTQYYFVNELTPSTRTTFTPFFFPHLDFKNINYSGGRCETQTITRFSHFQPENSFENN